MKTVKKSKLHKIIKEENNKIQENKKRIRQSFEELDALVVDFKKELEFCTLCEEKTQKVLERIVNG